MNVPEAKHTAHTVGQYTFAISVWQLAEGTYGWCVHWSPAECGAGPQVIPEADGACCTSASEAEAVAAARRAAGAWAARQRRGHP